MTTNLINGIRYVEFKPSVKVKHVLVAIHGFGGDAESSTIAKLATDLAEHNVAVVAFDLHCHGADTSQGNLDLNKCFEYLESVMCYVERHFACPISFFATSFGGYLLLNYLKDKPNKYNKIILRAPAVYMDEILVNKILPEHGYTKNDLESGVLDLGFERNLYVDITFYNQLLHNRLHLPNPNYFYHIIQGQKDNIVDYKQNELFFNESKHKYYYFPNADHRFKKDGELDKISNIVETILFKKSNA